MSVSADEFYFSIKPEEYIYDYARILTPGDKDILNNKLKNLKTTKNINFLLIIFDSLPYETDYQDFDEFTQNVFNSCDLENKNKSLLLIMSIKARKIKVILGTYYNIYYQLSVDKIIDNKVISDFKKNNYNKGIYVAVNEIIKIISKDINFFKYYKIYIYGCLLIISIFLFIIILKFTIKKNKIKKVEHFGDGATGRWI
jgi:uncharacterized membrane protein YgcG